MSICQFINFIVYILQIITLSDLMIVVNALSSLSSEVCKYKYFRCENSTVCIPQSSNCNGEIDCPNGSDERDCDDESIDAYWDRIYLKRTSAQFDEAKKQCGLNNYFGDCICQDFNILCTHKNLESIPEFDNSTTNEQIIFFNLEGNNFQNINESFFQTMPQNVEILNMPYCNIKKLQPNAFYEINKVEHLHLDNNYLELIPTDLFSKINKLKELTIRHNLIKSIEIDAFKNLNNLEELDLRGNKLIEVKQKVLKPLQNLINLNLQDNQIEIITQKSFPNLNLKILSLVGNRIKQLENNAFASLYQLEDLYLSHNLVKKLENETFANLTNLLSLSLDNNLIRLMEVGAFSDCVKLSALYLRRNKFKTVSPHLFQPLKALEHIYFDWFELCDSAPTVKDCLPKGDGISSHDHLLDNPVLRASVWIVGIIGCTGNLIVFFSRFLVPTNNVVHSLYLRNLAISDFLMSIYLFIIAHADYNYRGVYLRHQYDWRHSFRCHLSGFLSTLSCESCVLILTLVTWDRFVSVTQPLARKQLSVKAATCTLLTLWTIAACVALAPFTKGYFGDEFYGSNGVCLPLHIHEPFAMGWEYSAAMFMLVNTLALIFICYAYLRMISAIRASGVACRSTRQARERENVAHRFGVIILTDALCWLPVIAVKMAALAGRAVPETIYAWLAIFVLPINSALNPVLYTLTTKVFTKRMRKWAGRWLPAAGGSGEKSKAARSESAFSFSGGLLQQKRVLSLRESQASVATSKTSWKRSSTAV